MTKVQLDYDLQRKIDDGDSEALAGLHGYYGIQKLRVAPSLDRITVEYDATRLTPQDVDHVLVQYGLPIVAAAHRG